jgi:adenosylcobinamide kinase/adenosylcobinamide-phosphate guanylyltransferase
MEDNIVVEPKKIILILGGARSGKSSLAQSMAQKMADSVLFVATSEPLDDEMKERIEKHRNSRPSTWRTLEISHKIGSNLESNYGDSDVIIIDCLTLLISNLIGDRIDPIEVEEIIVSELNELAISIQTIDKSFIIVSNEVGMGIVPENQLARIYRDYLGKANQLIAELSDEVYFMVAGIPIKIK